MIASFSKSKLSKFLIPSFAKVYKIDCAEMEKSLEEYQSLHEFFTRKLKKDSRMIVRDALAVISPVDAVIQDIGTISPDYSITVKGKPYTISEMLGGRENSIKYLKGTYMIFYLSPSNYHRIHSPVTGKIINRWELGSRSYPVNAYGLKYGKRPLAKNFRKITEIFSNGSCVAIVKVGAMFVNSIELITTESQIKKGDEMAYFSFGSTVVLLFEEGCFKPALKGDRHYPIRVGECIGYMKAPSTSKNR